MSKGGETKNDKHKALPRAKNQMKILKDTVRRQSTEWDKANKEISKLKKENEKLKKELEAKKKPPKWAKPNKNKNADGSKKKGKKRGPKKGHKPHPRKCSNKVDQETSWVPLVCPDCDSDLPESLQKTYFWALSHQN